MLSHSLLNFSFVVVDPIQVEKGIYVLVDSQAPWSNFLNSIQSVVLDLFLFFNFLHDWPYFPTLQPSFASSLLTLSYLSLSSLVWQ